MLYWMTIALLTVLGALCLDRILGLVLRRLEPLLPNEIAGPNGWFVDTSARSGIYDPR